MLEKEADVATPMRRFRLALLAATCLGIPVSAGADELETSEPQATSALQELSLEELLAIKVTVASKTAVDAASAPSTVTVFTRDQIRNMGVLTLEELLNYVPGYQALRDVEQGVSERIAVRGRSTALSHSVLLLVDGQRLNDLYSGGVSILNRAIAVENIEQVEIIRGPGSALYGANAFTGVVNIKTLRGAGSIALWAGSQGARLAAVSASATAGDLKLSGFARTYRDSGFEYENVLDAVGQVGPQRDPLEGGDITLTAEYKGLTIRARHMQRDLGGFLAFGSLQDDASIETTRQSSLSAEYVRDLSAKTQLTLSASYADDDWRATTLFFPAGFELAPGFVLQSDFRAGPKLSTRVWRGSVGLQSRLDDNDTIVAGIEGEREAFSDIASFGSYNPLTLEPQTKVERFTDPNILFTVKTPRKVFGAYIQESHDFASTLHLVVGLRTDSYSDFGTALSPRAALVYETPIDSYVKAIYGHAFRAPNYLELYDRNNPVDFGNSELSAEDLDSFELAYVQRFKKHLQVSATLFESRIDDIITFGAEPPVDPFNPFGVPTFANGGSQTIRGIEFEAQASIARGLDARGSFTYVDDGSGAIPAKFGSAVLSYAVNRLRINLSGVFRARADELPNQGAYALVNARVAWRIGTSSSVFVNVRNLFDKEYLTSASLIPSGVPNRGRQILAGLTSDF